MLSKQGSVSSANCRGRSAARRRAAITNRGGGRGGRATGRAGGTVNTGSGGGGLIEARLPSS